MEEEVDGQEERQDDGEKMDSKKRKGEKSRFFVVNASLKSERFLTGPLLPELLREIHQFFLYRKYSACVI